MYRLFLCLRYLRSKIFAYFAVLGVALCVWMMLVSVSVMSGFLAKIELAAKGLFGDIVIEPVGERGFGHYDEFIAEIVRKVPAVEAADPFILSFGILRVEGDPNYRQLVQIAGIRLPSRADVTDFENGMFIQAGTDRPTFDVPLPEVIAALEDYQQQMWDLLKETFPQAFAKLTDDQARQLGQNWLLAGFYLKPHLTDPQDIRVLNRMVEGGRLRYEALMILKNAVRLQPRVEQLQQQLDQARRQNASASEIDDIRQSLEEVREEMAVEPPADRIILGLGIPGLSFRTEQGRTVRYIVPGHRVILSVAPLGKRLTSEGFQPNIRRFTVIDDNRSDVSSIDTKLVYVPFETLQQLNHMGAETDIDSGEVVIPARCSQIHVKVVDPTMSEQQLRQVAAEITTVWDDFRRRYPSAANTSVGIETWRQRQASVVGPIESQRTLVIIIMGIMSIVAVALVFVILYTIVVQKTREIGVLKAVGASAGGVAGLFFLYGAVIGLTGSVIGTAAGYFTTRHINTIQDWFDQTFGYRVWSKEQFMFEMIPNEVDWGMAIFIAVGAILAGLVGALIPAIRAARMQPVESLRYE
jgi:lipoprotein-releasing system permease protein